MKTTVVLGCGANDCEEQFQDTGSNTVTVTVINAREAGWRERHVDGNKYLLCPDCDRKLRVLLPLPRGN